MGPALGGRDRGRERVMVMHRRSWTVRRGSRPLTFTMVSSRLPIAASLLVVAAAGACNATVDPIGGGPNGSGGEDGSASAVTSTSSAWSQGGNGPGGGEGGFGGGSPTAAGGAGPRSIAMFESEVPGAGGDGGIGTSVVGAGGSGDVAAGVGGASGTGGAPTGGERLLVVVSNGPTECSDPFASCVNGSRAYIWLPPGGQEQGAFFFLSELQTWFDESVFEGEECVTGGGSFLDGTIQVLSADAESLAVQLEGTVAPQLDGIHPVDRCTPLRPDSAIAYFSSDLPGGEGGAGTTTASGGEAPYWLHFADHAVSCVAPYPTPGSDDVFETFRIPISLAILDTDAVYQLADFDCEYNRREANSAAVGGSMEYPGTITFREVTSTHITAIVSGSGFDFVDGETVIPRCGN
jgi:hypothetical protein